MRQEPQRSAAIVARPVFDLLQDAVARFPDRAAVDHAGRSLSYARLGALVNKAACGLQEMGVAKGTRVGLCLPNSLHFVVLYFAVLRAGGVVVNFNPLYVERELHHQIEDSGTSIMVAADSPEVAKKVTSVLDTSSLRTIILCPMGEEAPVSGDDPRIVGFTSLLTYGEMPAPVEVVPERDLAVLQYTGGTTGRPKGAMLTHANIWANAMQLNRRIPEMEAVQDRLLGVLPLFHAFAMTAVMNLAVARGAELILVARFDIEEVLALIEARRPTLFPGVPTLYTAINSAMENRTADLSSIRFCISGGAPLPLDVLERFEGLTGCTLVEGYGLSEASPVVTCNPFTGPARPGSIGTALDDTIIEVRDPADLSRVLPDGERGELFVRGPQVMAGYWQRPDETHDTFIAGALRTGDIGYRDQDGFYFLVDRAKDLIICGGYNVYPRVIEEALYRHPAVLEAVVIGLPDPYRGQAPKAYVSLRTGARATVEEIFAFLRTQISRIEMPKALEIRDALPRTAVGKLSKISLIEEEKTRR
ncbi:MAG: long-chain fatty acid--CoA ligase [Xanthobacter sp.]